jgi:hypothetical protein
MRKAPPTAVIGYPEPDGEAQHAAPGAPKRLADHIPPDQTASVVGLIEECGRSVFVIPERFLHRTGPDLPFHLVGGKRRPGEDWTEALQREVTEEIGVTLDIRSAAFTRQVTGATELAALHLADVPQPCCLYRRIRPQLGGTTDSGVNWVVGYQAGIVGMAALRPQAEIAAVLLLTPHLLARAASRELTYGDISIAGDGSEVITRSAADFDPARLAVPTGLAAILAA